MAVNTNGVFVTMDTDALFQFHFFRCGLLNHTIYNDRDEFVSSTHDNKIVCLQMPYPVDPGFDTELQYFADNADSVLVLVSELHNRTIEMMQRNDRKNISYFICGELNFSLSHSPVHKFYDWFTTSVHFYREVRPHTLDALNPYSPKKLAFDILLGRRKLHRQVAYDYLADHQLMDKNIVTYLGDDKIGNVDSDKWIWEREGLEIDREVEYTVERFPYFGNRICISQILPITIYNQTAYSIIAETNWASNYSFYTEKTVKPIIGRRLFVILAGQHYLRNLKLHGFKSFDNVIDETYDTIADDLLRFKAGMDQVEYLCNQPQEQILEKIKPIVDHNFNIMMTTNWYDLYFKPAFVSHFC